MGLLEGKTALIFGVANKRSIAWGITQAMHREGAKIALSYGLPQLERRVRPLAEEVGADFVELCDVSDDAQIEAVFEKVGQQLGKIDILVHSIGFADRDDLMGRFVDTSRAGFKMALDISAFSFTALVRAALPHFNEGASALTLSYYGAAKAVPAYNVMGVAKAALEASVRYLAADLGPDGIRVNAISAGAIKTLASSGVSGFRSMFSEFARISPLKRNMTQDEVGNSAVYLCSDWASAVTGEIHYVDAGANIIGFTLPEEDA